MSVQNRSPHHSDLAPSSKDWNPASSGHDEDYTPEKDLWAQTHGGGDKRPTEAPKSKQEKSDDLDEELEETFPASDPPASTDPATGWEIDEKKK